MMIADLTICYMLFSCASKYQNERTCDDLRIYLRNFAGILRVRQSLRLGAHIISMAFLVAMAISMLQKKYVSTGVFYTLALFFSNYALILLPVILLYQIYAIVTDKSSIVKNAVTMAACFAVFYLISLPLCWSEVAKGDVLCVFFPRCMRLFASANSKLSDNAFNLFMLSLRQAAR